MVMIAESQQELSCLKLVASINNRRTPFQMQDVLSQSGQFERIEPVKMIKPEGMTEVLVCAPEWSLNIMKVRTGGFSVGYFAPSGPSMESFLRQTRITIMLFRNSILFGVQKTSKEFKLKYSCRPSEVFWDFNPGTGPDAIAVYAPFGRMCLRVAPAKKEAHGFEKRQWIERAKALDATDEFVWETERVEICYTSWVEDATDCVRSQLFCSARRRKRR